jgi:hypothetical protein
MIWKLKLKKVLLFLYMSANMPCRWYNSYIRKEGIGMVLPLKKPWLTLPKSRR